VSPVEGIASSGVLAFRGLYSSRCPGGDQSLELGLAPGR
jgi:hypothetical protein